LIGIYRLLARIILSNLDNGIIKILESCKEQKAVRTLLEACEWLECTAGNA